MPPAHAVRLGTVFAALVIVIGAAGYGIGRGIEESDGDAACERYIERLKRDIQQAQEEDTNGPFPTRYKYFLTDVLVGEKDASCTCKDIAEALPAFDLTDC